MIKNVLNKINRVGIFVLFAGLFFSGTKVAGYYWLDINVGESSTDYYNTNLTVGLVDSYGNFETSQGTTVTRNVLRHSRQYDKSVTTHNNSTVFYYRNENGINFYDMLMPYPAGENKKYTAGGLINKFYVSDYLGITNLPEVNYSYDTLVQNFTGTYEDLQSLAGNIDNLAIGYSNNAGIKEYDSPIYCFRSSTLDKSVCFRVLRADYIKNNSHPNSITFDTGTSNNYVGTYINSLGSINSEYIGTSPLVGGGGSSDGTDGTLIPLDSDVDMVINYYEQRGYRESMCYVGTDNLTATFGTSGVSFNDGSGDSIFGLYNSIYSGFGNNIIQNVGKFINVRDINYGQWFYCDGENCPRWLAELTGNDVNINLIYTGLTFPFANKPVAIYFMASNLSETYNIDTHGQDVAFYCYSKLNRDSISDGSIDYSDIRELAGSGVLNKVDTYNQYLIDYYTPKGTFQVPTSGEFWDSFWSGGDYSSDNSQSISSSFSNYFTKFTNVFQGYSPAYSVGIIPDWIIFPLIFLILFRIMKH